MSEPNAIDPKDNVDERTNADHVGCGGYQRSHVIPRLVSFFFKFIQLLTICPALLGPK